jgi:phosphatidylglycerophosphatase A
MLWGDVPSSRWSQRVALVVATGLGLGYVPVAPGTAGSALGALLAWVLYRIAGAWGIWAGVLGVTALGIWAASRAEEHYGTHDSPHIVVDEIAGQLLTMVAVPCTWVHLLVGFGWFRLFDSVKPFPAGWIDREMKGGLGVVVDDLAAGIYSAAATALMVHSGLISRSLRWMLSFS